MSAGDDITPVLAWLKERQRRYPVTVERIGIRDLPGWSVSPESGNISHVSGGFFSIIGVRITGAADREVPSWTQPILWQEQCSVSGVIRKCIGGVDHYLFYAKFEPGNIDLVQLSPAVQATESNLSQAHHGKRPRLAEYFEDGGKGRVVKSVVAVEDGGRFYRKTNRSMLVEVPEDEEVPITDDYIWLTLTQVKKLLEVDLVMNSLAREVCALL
jgi:oxidase EvaA